MVFITLMTAAITIPILLLVCIVAYKLLIRKQSVNHFYTPFDHAAGQTDIEYHEEKEEKEEEEGWGDDKDKNLSKAKSL